MTFLLPIYDNNLLRLSLGIQLSQKVDELIYVITNPLKAYNLHFTLWAHPSRPHTLLLFIAFSIIVFNAFAQPYTQLIDDHIARYRHAFPAIEFKLLHKNEDLNQLFPLTDSLGEGLSNVDYEHLEEARVTLVEAQEHRIGMMIDNDMSSATLFKTPNARVTDKPYVCLITLNHIPPGEDPLAATRFIYDLDEATLVSMPESLRIDNKNFLLYSIDHEIFHCLDAYTNGALFPMTHDEIKASKDRARIELRTEIFAAMSHIARQPDQKGFLRKLANARTLNILSWDVEHYTSEVLYQLADKAESFTDSDITAIVQKSMKLSEKMAPTFPDYKEFLVTAWAVLEELGINTYQLPSHYAELADELSPKPDKVNALTNEIKMVNSAIRDNQ